MKIASDAEAIINRDNLLRIKAFMLRNGETRSCSQMYNNNPAFSTERYEFYLNPDPGGPHDHPQWNINCDPEMGDFHTLVVRRDISGDVSDEDFRDQYRFVDFSDPAGIVVLGHDSGPSRDEHRMKSLPEDAIAELLRAIEEREKS